MKVEQTRKGHRVNKIRRPFIIVPSEGMKNKIKKKKRAGKIQIR